MAQRKKDKIDSKLKVLEKIVLKFEKGKMGIEEGITEYEKASKLIKQIKKELTSIELKIEEIRDDYE